MADVITLTAQPYRLTTQTQDFYPPLWTAREVLAYDTLDIECGVIGFDSPGASPTITIGITTSLHAEAEEGWISVGTITLTRPGPPGPFGTQSFTGNFLRHIRWWIPLSGWGTQSAATFWIRGIARTHQEILAEGMGNG